MALADTFQQIVDSLPDDWTDLELDVRIFDEDRYMAAAVFMVTCNSLRLLDEAGIEGELALREVRTGRTEIVQTWGRPESVRQEWRRIRAQ